VLFALSFLVTACVYASVGFGGGSTYNALLVLAGVDYQILPIIALLCNLIVVTGGTFRFARAGHVETKKIIPWIVTSIPAAWLGGFIRVPETAFIGILGVSLFLCGLRLIIPQQKLSQKTTKSGNHQHIFFAPLVGTLLGGLSGIVGIGGGIFLAPILHLLRWDHAKSIAAVCSLFILVNSIAGLIGHSMKIGSSFMTSVVLEYWMLFPAVLIGGQIGSYLGAVHLQPKTIRLLTGFLTLYVSGRLLWRWVGMF